MLHLSPVVDLERSGRKLGRWMGARQSRERRRGRMRNMGLPTLRMRSTPDRGGDLIG
jgi:hypothetical protein